MSVNPPPTGYPTYTIVETVIAVAVGVAGLALCGVVIIEAPFALARMFGLIP